MTRKRFVKKLMGFGYSRNEANQFAQDYLRKKEQRCVRQKDYPAWLAVGEATYGDEYCRIVVSMERALDDAGIFGGILQDETFKKEASRRW